MIILLIGVLVVVGMIAWNFLRHQQAEQEFENYDEGLPEKETTTSKTIDNPETKPIRPKKNDNKSNKNLDPISIDAEVTEMPSLIQFSIVAESEEGFSGEEIFAALEDVNLEYGNLQIFERLDSNRLVDFAVANIVNPGTFPKDNLADFRCPGLSFFMQPKKIVNRIEVFEDFIRTFNFVAIKLNGQMIDSKRKILTDEGIQQIRQTL